MSATMVMTIAFGALILGHWANNQPTFGKSPGKMIIELAFALLVIALLDQGETADIAKGFAWLFLAAVLLRKDSLLTGLAKVTGTGTGAPK